MASIADEIEYKLDEVPATRIASDDIDNTFRSSSIGKMACLEMAAAVRSDHSTLTGHVS